MYQSFSPFPISILHRKNNKEHPHLRHNVRLNVQCSSISSSKLLRSPVMASPHIHRLHFNDMDGRLIYVSPSIQKSKSWTHFYYSSYNTPSSSIQPVHRRHLQYPAQSSSAKVQNSNGGIRNAKRRREGTPREQHNRSNQNKPLVPFGTSLSSNLFP